MKSRDSTLTLALCCSLAAHAVLTLLVLRAYTRDLQTRLPFPGFARADGANPHEAGESTGTGNAFNSAAGDLPLQARLAPQEQASLSLDPPGASGPLDPALPGAPPPLPPMDPAPDDHPFGPSVAMAFPAPSTPLISTNPMSPTTAPAAVVVARPAAPTPQPSGAPSSPPSAPPGDPAPESDSESDPFSETASVTFHAGQVDARFGRKVKTSRPRIDIAGWVDALASTNVSVVLKVKTDAAGAVTAADVLKSSGSVAIDVPCREAMFRWWIEPPKSPDGTPRPDVMIWTLNFR